MRHISTNHLMPVMPGPPPSPKPAAICPACGRSAIALGGNQFQCGACGRVGLEPVGLSTFLHTDRTPDGEPVFALDNRPVRGEIRWACQAIPGCTHDTEDEANRHARELLR